MAERARRWITRCLPSFVARALIDRCTQAFRIDEDIPEVAVLSSCRAGGVKRASNCSGMGGYHEALVRLLRLVYTVLVSQKTHQSFRFSMHATVSDKMARRSPSFERPPPRVCVEKNKKVLSRNQQGFKLSFHLNVDRRTRALVR